MYDNYYFQAEFFCILFLDHEVDFYFKDPSPEIRKQMLMIACLKTQIFLLTHHLDCTMYKVSVALELLREAPALMNGILVAHSFKTPLCT